MKTLCALIPLFFAAQSYGLAQSEARSPQPWSRIPDQYSEMATASAAREARFAINQDVFSAEMLGAAEPLFDTLSVPLLDGAVVEANIAAHHYRGSGHYTVRAQWDADTSGYIILTYENGVIVGVAHDYARSPIHIESDTFGYITLTEVDSMQLRPCGGGLTRPAPARDEVRQVAASMEPLSGPVVIDVAIAYTPEARAAAGSHAAIIGAIETAVDQSNLSMNNSNIDVEYRLVYRGEIDYVEMADMLLDLNLISEFIDEIQCIRDHYGADLVTLVTEDGQFGGLAWILCGPNPVNNAWDGIGFSVVDRLGLPVYTLVHEWGHNLGCDHDNDNLSGCRAYDYSRGYRFFQNAQQRRTIMAYWPGSQVAHFSNPGVDFFGVATGVTNQFDNARTIRNTATAIAAYRPTQYPVGPPVPSGVAVIPVQSNVVRISWQGCGAEGYIVRRNGTVIGHTADTYFIDASAAMGPSHCWTVAATNYQGISAQSAAACLSLPGAPQFVLDGRATHSGYLLSDPGMVLYAAMRGTELYVSTWSSGIFPDDNDRNDHFIFVSDVLLPSASVEAPWAKSGQIAVPGNKPFLAAESNSEYIDWFNAPAGSVALKSPFNNRQMEGIIDLEAAFGAVPTNIYVAVAAYNTQDDGALIAQAPAGSGLNIDPHEFLVINTIAIADETGNGTFDRLDPATGFVTHAIDRLPSGHVQVGWASFPGQSYAVEWAATPSDSWQLLTNVTAAANQLDATIIDTAPGATSRIYRVGYNP